MCLLQSVRPTVMSLDFQTDQTWPGLWRHWSCCFKWERGNWCFFLFKPWHLTKGYTLQIVIDCRVWLVPTISIWGGWWSVGVCMVCVGGLFCYFCSAVGGSWWPRCSSNVRISTVSPLFVNLAFLSFQQVKKKAKTGLHTSMSALWSSFIITQR